MRELHTHIHLDYVRVEILSCIQKLIYNNFGPKKKRKKKKRKKEVELIKRDLHENWIVFPDSDEYF